MIGLLHFELIIRIFIAEKLDLEYLLCTNAMGFSWCCHVLFDSARLWVGAMNGTASHQANHTHIHRVTIIMLTYILLEFSPVLPVV